MAPRTQITAASQRPTDKSLAFFVRHFVAGQRGVRVLWTDSRQYADTFAASHRCYARPAEVQVRSDWEIGHSIGFSESHAGVVVT